MIKKNIKYYLRLISLFIIFNIFNSELLCQDLDVDELLNRLDRIERNISDLQKGILGKVESNLTSGYISRNESRFDDLETLNQSNFGKFEEIQNKVFEIEKKLDLINADVSTRFSDIENAVKKLNNKSLQPNISNFENNVDIKNKESEENITTNSLDVENKISESEAKLKYENAIKLLWSGELEQALNELQSLKKIEPENLMPNIQYWLGEVYYAKKDFSRAVLEFGEGLKNYPESIKGPDNMLKLGLSFSNLNKKTEACNVLIELDFKYPDSSKNVLQRALKERKNLGCPKE